MSQLPVTLKLTTAVKQFKDLDLYSVHQAFTAAAGIQEAFLFESVAGPLADKRFSMLGCHKLFELSFFGETLIISGLAEPVALVSKALLANKLIAQQQQHYVLHPGVDIWAFLKSLHRLFNINAHDAEKPWFSSGFLSTFDYDFSWRIENLPRLIEAEDPAPDLALGFFQSILYFDYAKKTSYLTSNQLDCKHPVFALDQLDLTNIPPLKTEDPQYQPMRTVDKAEYLAWVERAMEHIRAGDIYQVQLGHEILVKTDISPQAVYHRLRQNNPSPYMFFSPCHDRILVGASPELYVRKVGSTFVMRPIAGTIRRGATEAEDQQLIAQLEADEKERAEHLMLIDLCRNDMGRICKPGSLDETDIMFVEKYSHVSHLVSNIVATLQDGQDIYDIMKATFPAGTMSGAPKVRAMEIIEAFEKSRRIYYAGAVGFIDLSGEAELGLMIRTTSHKNGCYHLRASAGIVIESVAESEWLETLAKMSAPYKAITGKELKREDFIN